MALRCTGVGAGMLTSQFRPMPSRMWPSMKGGMTRDALRATSIASATSSANSPLDFVCLVNGASHGEAWKVVASSMASSAGAIDPYLPVSAAPEVGRRLPNALGVSDERAAADAVAAKKPAKPGAQSGPKPAPAPASQ